MATYPPVSAAKQIGKKIAKAQKPRKGGKRVVQPKPMHKQIADNMMGG